MRPAGRSNIEMIDGRPVLTGRSGGFVEMSPSERETEMSKPEKLGLAYCPDSVMSNFDHTIDVAVAARLQEEPAFAQYSGWNFCGYVWWDKGAQTFNCEVWHYNAPVEVVSGSLEEIMDDVSDKYGWD